MRKCSGFKASIIRRREQKMNKDRKKQKRVVSLIREMDYDFLKLIIIKNLIEAAVPYLMILLPAFVIQLLYEEREAAQIMRFLLSFFLLFFAVRLFFSYLKKKVEDRKNRILNTYAVKKIRKVFYMQFSFLETSEFEKIQQGIRYNDENFGAFRNYIEELEKIIRSVFQIAIAIGIFVSMLMDMSGKAAALPFFLSVLGILIGILGCVFLMIWIQKWVNHKMPDLMDKIVDVNTIFAVLYEEVVQNYRKGKDIRLFGIDRLIVREGEKMLENFAPYDRKQIWLSQVSGMAGSIFSVFLGGISFAAMGACALSGYIAPGSVISFSGSIQQLSSAIIALAFSVGSLNLWNVRMDSTFRLFEREEAVSRESPSNKNLPELETIEFQDVSFRYPEGKNDILHHISLVIQKGEKIAVVGPNGSGKSTFIKLLTGLYEPTEGKILLNGQDRSTLSTEVYQTYMAAVYQDFMTFSFTLKDNLMLGREENIEKAEGILKKLKLSKKVEGMKEGMDTWLYQDYGEKGREVSGGEAQKLAICRALYKDSEVVVLDEPTAALDPVAEYEVYKDFRHIAENKTAVFVSHRLSSCRFCDRIFVFEHGKIVQKGSHEKLLCEKTGLYWKLWNVQAQYYRTDGEV